MAEKPIMIMGCTSDAGKSFLVAALCRQFANRGLRVAPFKAQNMSNNAAARQATADIGDYDRTGTGARHFPQHENQ